MLKDDVVVDVISDNGKESHAYGKIKDLVVNLSGDFYFRHATKYVTQIVGPDGRRRFYRKNSPLVTKDPDNPGSYLLKAACHLTEDGVYLSKTSPNVIIIEGKPYRKQYTVSIGGVHYLLHDPRITDSYYSGANILKESAVLLSEKYYQKGKYVEGLWAEKDQFGDWICSRDRTMVMDGVTGEPGVVHKNWLNSRLYSNITHDFLDKTNPQENRLISMAILKEFVPTNTIYIDLLPLAPDEIQIEQGEPQLRCPALIHKAKLEYFKKQINDYIVPRYVKNLEEVRKSISKNFSDLDDQENTAKAFKLVHEPWGGKINIHTSAAFHDVIESDKFSYTGGLKYSFGVEFETSQGLLSPKIVEALGLSCVGDRSIGAAEYVTPPVQGNRGLDYIKVICEALSKNVLVDDRCGFHVHVGGLTKTQRPSRDKSTLINAIRLGSYLEEELFTTLPPSRTPTNYYCHSIRRFSDINKENYADYMGGYLFGPKEWWLAPKAVAHDVLRPFFNFSDYSLGKGRNSKTMPQDQWCGGRYKWLNLIHAFFVDGKKTYEFRVFPATTNFEKAWAYIMFSIAFVYVIDNEPGIIKPGVTLEDVVNAAYSKSPKIRAALNGFHEARKAKFQRKTIYPKVGYDNRPLTFLNK